MPRYWIKLYHEILDDPKMGRLPDNLFRRVIELFLLAGEMHKDGLLPQLDDMAWRLRLDPTSLLSELIEIEKTGILSQSEYGWIVTKFAERQDADTEAERMRRYRQALRKDNTTVTNRNENVTNSSYENVTISVREQEQEEDKDKEQEQDNNSRPNIFTLYENTIGLVSPIISDELIEVENTYPPDWIEDAFRETARQNKHNWKYTLAILKSWKENGSKATKGNKSKVDPASMASEVW